MTIGEARKLTNEKEKRKRDAAYVLWEHHGWHVKEIALAVDRSVFWVAQTLKDFGV